MKTIRIFLKSDCPRCPAAKVLGNVLSGQGYEVNLYDVDTVDGLAEAAYYGVLATPTVLLTDGDDDQLAAWRGMVPPEDEVKTFL